MTDTQSSIQSKPAADVLLMGLEREIASTIANGERRAVAAAPPPSAPLRGDPKAGGGGASGAPVTTRITSPSSNLASPLQLLAQVADHAHAMNAQMLQLVTALTGEQAPAPRLRQAPMRSTGLLPNIAAIAHEIEEAHLMTSRLIEHARSRL
jgi:hypothetical protein